MAKAKGNKKGAPFERKIAKQLSLWWTRDERDDIFWRTPGSGARHTVRQKVGKDTKNSAGDIGCQDEIGRPFIDYFLIELKVGYNKVIDPLAIFDSPRKKKHFLLDVWAKAEKEREQVGRRASLLIFQRDFRVPFVIIKTGIYDILAAADSKTSPSMLIDLEDGYKSLLIVSLEKFLLDIKPNFIKDSLKC